MVEFLSETMEAQRQKRHISKGEKLLTDNSISCENIYEK